MVRKAVLCLAAWCVLVPGMVSGEPLVADEAFVSEMPGSDPVLTRTTEQKEAARATLEVIREESLPGRLLEQPAGWQRLPGETSFRETVREISEIDEIKPGRPLTLQEALLMADAQNIDLEAARVKIEIAQAQLKQAWALLMPNISATLQWVHLGQVPSMNLGGLGDALSGMGTLLGKMGLAMVANGMLRPEDLEGLGNLGGGSSGSMAMASQDTVNFGLTVGLSIVNVAGWFQLRMLDEVKRVTELGIENGRQALLAGVAQIYLAALLTGEVVKIQRVQLISALDQLALAQGRFERGVDVRLSVIQAQFGVEQARQALIDAIWSYETTRDAMAIILNTDGLPVPQPVTIRGVENMTDEALEDEAIQQNRALQINRATQHIQTLNLNAAIAGFFPTLAGAWQYSYTLTDVSASMSGQKSSWTLALSLNIPLFDYSKYGLLDERRAALRETQLLFESTQQSTKQAVRKAKREYFSSIFAVDNAKRQVELATEALHLTEAAYANGVSTFIDLSNARNRAAAASIAHVTSQIQANLSLISLISSLGRDIMEIVY
ncbi:MAG: TolC family protein [Proteobacteria bacterium]|nr:TolC family protein [Pseudomonadota bacterium]